MSIIILYTIYNTYELSVKWEYFMSRLIFFHKQANFFHEPQPLKIQLEIQIFCYITL